MVTSRASREPTTTSASDRKSTRLNSSHDQKSYAVFCLKKKNVDDVLAAQSETKNLIKVMGASIKIIGESTLPRCMAARKMKLKIKDNSDDEKNNLGRAGTIIA